MAKKRTYTEVTHAKRLIKILESKGGPYEKCPAAKFYSNKTDYNEMWENLGSDRMRHKDHRFEWTRAEFKTWAETISRTYGYNPRFLDIGHHHEKLGSPTQMCIFTIEN